LHLLPTLGEVPFREWFSKRSLGALNYWWERREQFGHTPAKIAKLAEFARAEKVDAVLCTGDYTLWGTEFEYGAARPAVQPLIDASPMFVTCPGNHDLYTQRVVDQQRFGRYFGDMLETDRLEIVADGHWPLVRYVGDDVVVIAVNSAIPHWEPWKASGRISDKQIDALRRLLSDPTIRRKVAFVMIHHAPRLADGSDDSFHHGLENADEFLEACSAIRRGGVLFGHVHHAYEVSVPELSVPLYGCGSSTLKGRESIRLFEIDEGTVRARQGVWVDDRYELVTTAAVD
jgi:3',5'-cyclic AMP phosphodiesterase CpdA